MHEIQHCAWKTLFVPRFPRSISPENFLAELVVQFSLAQLCKEAEINVYTSASMTSLRAFNIMVQWLSSIMTYTFLFPYFIIVFGWVLKKIPGSIWHKLAHTRVEKQYLKDTLLYITQKYDVPIPHYMQNNANHRRYRNLPDKP